MTYWIFHLVGTPEYLLRHKPSSVPRDLSGSLSMIVHSASAIVYLLNAFDTSVTLKSLVGISD